MKRNAYKLRYPTCNTGREREIVPIHCMEVLPTDTISMSFFGSIVQATTTRPYATHNRFRWASFYCPHRIAWDGWVDYLTGASSTSPMTTPTVTLDGFFFDDGSAASARFVRDTYREVYNEYFRHPSTAEVSLAPGAMTPLFADRVGLLDYDWGQTPDQDEDVTFSGAVSGADVTISMDELAAGLARRRQRRAERDTGDEYVDALRRFGVDAGYAVADRPEYLGGGTFRLGHGPLTATSAGAANLGDRSTAAESAVKGSVKRKSFAEHGTVLTVLVSDPHSYNAEKARPLGLDYRDRDWLFTPSQADKPQDEVSSSNLVTTGFGELYFPPWERYRRGEELPGRFNRPNPTDSWVWARSAADKAGLLSADNQNLYAVNDSYKGPSRATNDVVLYQAEMEFMVRRISQVPPRSKAYRG